MVNAITGVDHVIIAVADLEAAAEQWRALGFTVTPRGRHIGMSTGNYCIMFENSYIELLGIVDDSLPIPDFAPKDASSEGMTGIVMANEGGDRVVAALENAGIDHFGQADLIRDLELASGTVQPRFTNIYLKPETLPGFQTFYCFHETPELTRADPSWQVHENGARDIKEVFFIVENPDEAVQQAERLCGTPIRAEGGSIFTLGNVNLHILTEEDALQDWPNQSVGDLKKAPLFGGMVISTDKGEKSISPDQANGVAVRLLSH